MSIVKQKTDQAVKILSELDIDLWLIYVRKTSEIHDPSLYFLLEDTWLTWQSAIIISKSGQKIVICGRYDAQNIEASGIYDKVISYDQSIKEDLLTVLNEFKPKNIAINYSFDNIAADGLTHGMWLRLNKMLEDTEYINKLISSEDLLAALRGRKTELELENIRKAVDFSELGHKKVSETAKIGISEEEIEEMLLEFTKENNLTVSYPPLVHVGPSTSIGHGKASPDIKIKKGDLINVDYGVFFEGYASDLQRMNYVLQDGEDIPPTEVRRAFETVIKAINAGAEKLKSGVQGWEVDNVARKVVTDAGYQEFMHALGHQIGRNVHDGGCLLGPRWEKYGKSVMYKIEKGQAFTLELHVYVENHGYCSVEENVIVTKDGCEFLSNRQLELTLLKL
ncbi:MAG: aminopeptidase P family protein [Candidatus Heimdallarchaeota archaeon]|nr:aminopeptidase P family protein [Candidatus Heimdallarchaeota archaeon]MCK5142562.1 aminopeptidase P family protein [Candidatus Heimdallarchaeota archaeon]